jgi:hypothetical protein
MLMFVQATCSAPAAAPDSTSQPECKYSDAAPDTRYAAAGLHE